MLASVVVVIAACGLAAWAGWAFVTYFERFGSDGGAEAVALLDLQTPVSVWWSGNGEYAVAQALDTNDTPKVVIRDVKRGTTRTLKGYRVVGVEPHAPRVWLVPDKRVLGTVMGSTETTPQLLDIAWDGTDSRPAELYALRLDSEGDPRSDVDARWTKWNGAAGFSASVEIDINKGSCPGSLRFEKTGSALNAWSAQVPTDVATFEPIGWSPSGRYFAVVAQADASQTAKLVAGYLDDWVNSLPSSEPGAGGESSYEETAGPVDKPRYAAAVLVFSAADGRLFARETMAVPVHDVDSAGARIAWSDTDDRLYMLDGAVEGSSRTSLKTLLLGAATADRIEPESTPWQDDLGGAAWLAGSDSGAALVCVNAESEGPSVTDVYRVGAAGTLEYLGAHQGAIALRWSAVGGMLSLGEYQNEGAWRVDVADIHGVERRRVLSLEAPSVAPGY